MENHQYFVVLQSDGKPQTVYPEVHYVFTDDEFSLELDALEQQPGDISIVVDLDAEGEIVQGCQSVSPEWQVSDVSLTAQALDSGAASRLLRVNGIHASQNSDISSFSGTYEEQIARGLALVEQLEQRNAAVRCAINDN